MAKIKVDQLLRVHIPNKIASDLSISAGDSLNYVIEGDRIVLIKDEPNRTCPVCSRSFSAEYQFCPYDGQYLYEHKEETNVYKEAVEKVSEADAYAKKLLDTTIEQIESKRGE